MVEEANLVGNNAEWIYDTENSRHFYTKKELMQEFEDVVDEEYVYMENSTSARAMGKGKILLKFTCGKLSNALFMSSLRKNLVSGILLNKVRLKNCC